MEGRKGTQLTPALAAAAAVVKAMFGSEDLIYVIILRLEFPTCLVRVAVTSSATSTSGARLASSVSISKTLLQRLLFVPVVEAPELTTPIRLTDASIAGDQFILFFRQKFESRSWPTCGVQPSTPDTRHALLPPPPTPTFNRFFFYKAYGGDEGVMALELEARPTLSCTRVFAHVAGDRRRPRAITGGIRDYPSSACIRWFDCATPQRIEAHDGYGDGQIGYPVPKYSFGFE
ncbi:hypothetical protein HU200_064311 [Digitaria exilis]|uniref:Uncharacterized protein n=1 Tax=Digitaria exilis TaxID=1010633 RepID=A0A835A040_9POAL|nr:hypothetical protein HU200_064311 [Digitaria exilis]